jgi:hypothetical protein
MYHFILVFKNNDVKFVKSKKTKKELGHYLKKIGINNLKEIEITPKEWIKEIV